MPQGPLISVTKGQKAKRSLKFLTSLNLPVRFCMVSNCCSSGCFSRPPVRKQTCDTLQHLSVHILHSARSASKCLYALATLVNAVLNTSVQRPVISTSARKAVCESNSNEDCSMQRQLWLRTLLTPSMPQKQPSLAPSFSSFCREFLMKSSFHHGSNPGAHISTNASRTHFTSVQLQTLQTTPFLFHCPFSDADHRACHMS